MRKKTQGFETLLQQHVQKLMLSMANKRSPEACGSLFAVEYIEMVFPMEYVVHDPFVRRHRADWGGMVVGPIGYRRNEVTNSDYNVKPKSWASMV